MAHSRVPKLDFSTEFPDWWNNNGLYMRVEQPTRQDQLRIVGSAAEIEISLSPKKDHNGGRLWSVKYQVRQARDCFVIGQNSWTDEELSAVFGLDGYQDFCPLGSEWLIETYGGNATKQKVFHRWNEFVNIPCPGTGRPGDPNISFKINDDMRMCIENMLRLRVRIY